MKNNSQLLREYNDALTSLYDTATTAMADAWTAPQEMASLVAPLLKEGEVVVDIGVGTGQSAEPLAALGAKIIGLDISAEMVGVVKAKHPDWDVRQVDIASGVFGVGNRFADGVVSCGCLEFVEDLSFVFSQVAEILKVGGFFCFTFELIVPDHPLQKDAVSTLGSGVVDPVPESLSLKVFRRTEAEVVELLKSLRFKVRKSHSFVAYHKGQQKYPVVYQIILVEQERHVQDIV